MRRNFVQYDQLLRAQKPCWEDSGGILYDVHSWSVGIGSRYLGIFDGDVIVSRRYTMINYLMKANMKS